AAARRALGDLPERHPTARALTIMAAIERGAGGEDAVVRGWLTRALSASRGSQWICDKCQHPNEVWSPVCETCGGFDTLSWREAVASPRGPSASDLLPLIVGKGEKDAPDTSAVISTPLAAGSPARPGADHPVYDAEFFDGGPDKKPAL
ncbi:MAG: heme biosynthesis protein HemY, partial [Rhodobacteraceae bacterium]|nr:heme biosynthesis protein HemY [Paracoccaceae bacterium]